jgi:hypothetical protein
MIENAAIAAAEIGNFYMYFGAGKVFIPVTRSGARLLSDAGLQASGVSLPDCPASPRICRLNGERKCYKTSKLIM